MYFSVSTWKSLPDSLIRDAGMMILGERAFTRVGQGQLQDQV